MMIYKYLPVLLLCMMITAGCSRSAVLGMNTLSGRYRYHGFRVGQPGKSADSTILQIAVTDRRRLLLSYEKDGVIYQVDTLQGWLNKRGHFVFDHHSKIEGVPPFLWTSTETDDRMIPSANYLRIRYKSETACFLFIMPVMAASAGPSVTDFERISPVIKHKR